MIIFGVIKNMGYSHLIKPANMRQITFLFSLLISNFIFGQNDYVYENKIFVDNIKTVQFFVGHLQMTDPIVDLQSKTLTLEFDDLGEEEIDYKYTVIHCTPDWKKSDLEKEQYIDGWEEEKIEMYEYSISTHIDYTHYTLNLPNGDFSFKLSGNYILIVSPDEEEADPVFMCRFVLVEPHVLIAAKMVKPNQVSKLRTHQAIDFNISYDKYYIQNPQKELTATIMQNGRWDNAIIDLPPTNQMLNKVIYNYNDKIIFPALKEFRSFDTRSTLFWSRFIKEIINTRYKTEVTLFTGKKRTYSSGVFFKDADGKFVIANDDRKNHLECDYLYILFSIETMELLNKDVYVFGALTDWKLKEEFRMNYVDDIGVYAVEVPVKQGYYNYYFATKDADGNMSIEDLEGSNFETGNTYTIIIYQRDPSGNYAKAIGYKRIESK